MGKWTCEHAHSGLQHYDCWTRSEISRREKVGYFDIESSALKADWGMVFTYCILDGNSNKMISRTVTKNELFSKELDKRLIEDCAKDLAQFDRIVTYYGTGFDLPFVRTRAVIHGIHFPEIGELTHTDVYYMVRNKFLLSRNRMANAEETLLFGKTEKTRWLHEHWIRAIQGNKESLEYILDHCEKDVKILKKLHNKIDVFARKTDKSI